VSKPLASGGWLREKRTRRFAISGQTWHASAHPWALRPGKTPSGTEIRGHLRRLVRLLRRHWPATRITIRGDGHYGPLEAIEILPAGVRYHHARATSAAQPPASPRVTQVIDHSPLALRDAAVALAMDQIGFTARPQSSIDVYRTISTIPVSGLTSTSQTAQVYAKDGRLMT
jgi:hypothetical protein